MFEQQSKGTAKGLLPCRKGVLIHTKTPWFIPETFPPVAEPECQKPCLKVRVCVPYEEAFIPAGLLVIPAPDVSVPNGMGDVYKGFCTRQGVVLVGPTGSGKSTYAAQIIKYAKANRQHVLLLCHRKLIVGQQKRSLAKKTGSKWKDVEDDLALELTSEFEDVHLTVLTYQSFAKRYRNMDLSKYGWLICDEVHYFATDALFSETADALLEQLPRLFKHARRIYMTATPDAVLEDLVRVEKHAQCTCCHPGMSCWQEGCGQMLMYQFPNRFQGLQLHYFQKTDEIVNLAKAHPGEKILIFVSARENPDDAECEGYISALRQAGIDVAYLDRERKGSKVWEELLGTSFSAQVLVTTSVIDCGVNIIDSSLKHVVLETTSKDEAIQMLGRRRRDPGETLNVYIRAASRATLSQRLRKTEEALNLCKRAYAAKSREQQRKILLEGWGDQSAERLYAKLLVPLDSGGFHVKLTAYHALRWQQGTLNRLIRMNEEYGDHSALPRLVHAWLEDPDGYSEENWLGFDRVQEKRLELIRFLEENKNHELDRQEYDEFRGALQQLLSKLLLKEHDAKRLLGERALNDRLEELDLPYQIQKVQSGYYQLCAKE